MDSELIEDALIVGAVNLITLKLLEKVFPNNIPAQIFLTGTVFHLSMERLRVKHFYLEPPEYK
jgi:hypothetical protein